MHSEKQALRRQIQAARRALPAALREAASALLCEALLASPEIAGVSSVALFWPMLDRGELDVRALDQSLRARGTRLYYPFMRGAECGFALVNSVSDFEVAPWGFRQPQATCHVAAPGELELIVAPALALTRHGKRLGYGAGFYDRVIAQFAPAAKVVGTCYQHELVDDLPFETHDRRVDFIATDAGVILVQ